jgi:hypothetical protein
MKYLESLFSSLFLAIPTVISAVLVLILAIIIATFVKKLVIKSLKILKMEKYTDKLGLTDEVTGSSLVFIGNLMFILVFLLFIPGILDLLGLHTVASSITLFVGSFLDFIPNLVAAVVILVVGIFIAKIIRQLITPLLKRINIDKLQEKAGIMSSENVTLSSVISNIAYVIILIPIVIAALQILDITAISTPAIAMLNEIFLIIPYIFVSIIIMIIGIFIAKLVGKMLTNLLSSLGTDIWTKKLIPTDSYQWSRFSFSIIIGEIVKYIIILLFTVEAFKVVKLEVLQTVGLAIIAYLPSVISAFIIIGIALFLGTWVETLILKNFSGAKVLAFIAKSAILVISVFMTLIQLGVATTIVNAAFIIILSSLALAFAIAFGLGGRDFAAYTLKKFETPKKDKE